MKRDESITRKLRTSNSLVGFHDFLVSYFFVSPKTVLPENQNQLE